LAIITIANHTTAIGLIGNFIRSYLAMVVWLVLIFINERSLIHRVMIFLVYLELNPVERIIENINHSVMVVKAIMLCMSLKQILFFPMWEFSI